jgi:uncharacterized protein YfiM (DUF2279 family)
VDAAHFFEQFAGLLEAGANAARERGQALQRRREVMVRQSDLLVEGTEAFAAAAAVVVGPAVAERAEQAD